MAPIFLKLHCSKLPTVHRTQRPFGGFTLIELMITVAVLGILAAIALPSYTRYVTKSRAQAATADLVGMALALENTFQKTLSYPVYATQTTISGGATNFTSWTPSQANYFTYSVTSDSSTFTVKATGTGAMSSNCVLTLTNANVRAAPSDGSCGITSW
jgi:type IV pilus assembly protein PilE